MIIFGYYIILLYLEGLLFTWVYSNLTSPFKNTVLQLLAGEEVRELFEAEKELHVRLWL